MGRIDASRVLVGGLLAGVVINIGEYLLNQPILGDEMEAMVARMGLEYSSAATATFIVLSFVMGIVAVWAYAAMRPRYGPGPATAVRAGLLAWFFTYVVQTVGWTMMGVFTAGTAALVLVWGLIELPLATVAGAWLYREPGEAPATAGVAAADRSPTAASSPRPSPEPRAPAG
ncbi:MAG: hypothetical protein ACODAE_10180, partial [Gemmatimonadota bacterium]